MRQKILFLVPYPLHESPSQRFRFEQYFRLLEEKKIHTEVQSFLNSHNWQIFFKSGKAFAKIVVLMTGFCKRLVVLLKAPWYDFIFIHREVTPVGPPVFEWILAKVLRKKIIYDFDDAIWLTDREKESRPMKFLKWRRKVRSICRWSHKISCGNEYLCAYALKFNQRVVHNPSTIDTQHWHNPELHKRSLTPHNQIVIGWTGSHSTLKYLKDVEAVLQKIEVEFPTIEILIIADKKPDLKLEHLSYIPWKGSNEIQDLLRIDIGIMPLPDDEWSKGKCGFKALQYMALEVSPVTSPVGVNSKIIDQGIDGFLCTTAEEWGQALTKLIEDPMLRKQMGERGRKKIIDRYSVTSNSSNFLSLFE